MRDLEADLGQMWQQWKPRLQARLAGAGDGPVYYYLTVTEIPSKQPTTPEEHGLRVERWYERYDTGTPITSATE